MNPLIVGMLGAGALSAIGNIVGAKTSSDAVAATNAANARIAKQQNDYNERMYYQQVKDTNARMERALSYMSPQEQRSMYEQAGYSPYAMLGNTPSVGTPSNPQAQPAVAPSYTSPLTPIGQGISQIGTQFASNLNAIVSARKTSLEADQQQMENDVFSERFKTTMESLNLGNQYQRIINKYADSKEQVTLDTLVKNKELTEQQIEAVKLSNAIQTIYKDKIQPQELNKLMAEIDLCKEQGLTQLSLRKYYAAVGRSQETMAHAAAVNAAVGQYLAKYQAELMRTQALTNEEQARLTKFSADHQEWANSLDRISGVRLREAQIKSISANGEYNENAARKVYNEIPLLQKQVSWYEFNQVSSALVSLGIFGKVFGAGAVSAPNYTGYGVDYTR